MPELRPQADRILVAQLHGEEKQHARWRGLIENHEAAAVAALRDLAAGQTDLLAEVRGLMEASPRASPTSRSGLPGLAHRTATTEPINPLPAGVGVPRSLASGPGG